MGSVRRGSVVTLDRLKQVILIADMNGLLGCVTP
jgi:hypothetical protein